MQNVFKYSFFIFTAIVLSLPQAFAQAPCRSYDCVIKKVETHLKKKEYQDALNNLESAEGYPNKKPDQIRTLRNQLFTAIESDRVAAVQAQVRAEKAEKAAKTAQKATEKALAKADSALVVIKAEQEKNERIIDAFYFYAGRFALAYKFGRYGYIDKEGDTRIDYIFKEALPFDRTGFARVNYQGELYLIDTLGTRYRLATNFRQLGPEVVALDLKTDKEIRSFPPDSLLQSPLQIVFVNGYRLDSIAATIGRLQTVERLNLGYNQLSNLPPAIGQLSRLKLLDVGHNRLQTLPETFGQLSQLTYLDLNENNIQELPPALVTLNVLQTLDLSFNQMAVLSPSIGKLQTLQTLNIGYNHLLKLPPEIGQLSRLTSLDLSHNQLSVLPKEMAGLTHLETLILSDNNFTKLPPEVFLLKNLVFLDLGKNGLQHLPESIQQFKKLELIDLSDNPISEAEKRRIKLLLPLQCSVIWE